jgi:hypothetical protein
MPGRLPALSVLGRRKEDNPNRGGLGGFDLAFKFSTLLLVLSVLIFPDACLSRVEDFDVEGIGAVLAAEATLWLPGLPCLSTSGSLPVSSLTFAFLY